MEVRLDPRRGPSFGSAIARGDVRFHPEDGFDLRFLGLLLELPRGVEITVIGNGERRLFQLLGALDQIVDPIGAVEKRVLRMAVEMDERHSVKNSRRMEPGQRKTLVPRLR